VAEEKKKKKKIKAKDKRYVIAEKHCLFCKSRVFNEGEEVTSKDLHNGGPDLHKLVKAGTLVEMK
jgi:hypothetical protein